MQVIGQHDKCVNLKRITLTRAPCRITQRFNLIGQDAGSAVQQVDCEEPTTARNKCTAIVWHWNKLPQIWRNTLRLGYCAPRLKNETRSGIAITRAVARGMAYSAIPDRDTA